MLEQNENEFIRVMETIGDIYDKKPSTSRIMVYWDAMSSFSIEDVKDALNRHVADPERGRFFPLPADVVAQLPRKDAAWLTADEAWATCPIDKLRITSMN